MMCEKVLEGHVRQLEGNVNALSLLRGTAYGKEVFGISTSRCAVHSSFPLQTIALIIRTRVSSLRVRVCRISSFPLY